MFSVCLKSGLPSVENVACIADWDLGYRTRWLSKQMSSILKCGHFSFPSSWTSSAWIRCTKARSRWRAMSSTWRALMVSQALSPATWMLDLLEPPQATRCSVPWRELWMEACPSHTGNTSHFLSHTRGIRNAVGCFRKRAPRSRMSFLKFRFAWKLSGKYIRSSSYSKKQEILASCHSRIITGITNNIDGGTECMTLE